MKKRVICLFSLIVYLLVACTVLSIKIEEEMMTQVAITTRKNQGGMFTLNQSVLFTDDSSQHLYAAIEGSGWDDGLRSQELTGWSIDTSDAVTFYGYEESYDFVSSASRTLRNGEEVAVIEEFTNGEDRYLYLYSDGAPEDFVLPNQARIISQTENAVLLELADAQFPFFEHTAINLTESTRLADRVFSLTEAEQFDSQLSSVALVFGSLAAGILFWAIACAFSIFVEEKRFLSWISGMLCTAALVCMILVMNRIDLPASMLPAEHIFDLEYYTQDASLITSALNKLNIP